MATADTSLPQGTASSAAKVSLVTLLICGIVTAIFAAGGVVGAMFYLNKRGRVSAADAPVTKIDATKKDVEAATHPKALEPMLVNLADEDGHAYLRVGLVLTEATETGAKPKEEAKPEPGEDAAVRDTIFDVLGRENSAALLAPDGKEKLKVELLAAIGKRNANLHVKAIYFTDFLVQR